ncbi:MAG: ankyrin repeat domain-containing protein [Archangium sp.]
MARKRTEKQLSKAIRTAIEDDALPAFDEALGELAARQPLPQAVLDEALLEAAQSTNTEFATRLLAAGANVNFAGRMSPLASAVRVRDSAMVELLLARGASPDSRGLMDGTTAIFDAVELGNVAHVKRLLAAGARLDLVDPKTFRCVLHEAVRKRMSDGKVPPVEILSALLAAGAKPELGDRATRPVLHSAIEVDAVEHTRVLLEAGANPNTQAVFRGLTALHVAFEARVHSIVPLLLERGADRSIADHSGRDCTSIYDRYGVLLG